MDLVYMYYSGYGYDMFMGSAGLLELLARDRLLTRTTIYSESRQIYEVIRSKVREEGRSWLLFLSWLGQAHTVTASSLVRSPGEVGLSGQGGRAWQDIDWPRLRVYKSEYSLQKGRTSGEETSVAPRGVEEQLVVLTVATADALALHTVAGHSCRLVGHRRYHVVGYYGYVTFN